MITILTWVSIIAGGILVLMLLLSLLGGLDIDVDVETGGGDVDTNAGGIGLMKGALTFISVSSWVMKVLMVGQQGKILSIVVGVLSGIVAFALLNYLLKALMKNEENVNWEIGDALFQSGTTYLKIPTGGEGLVRINVKGAMRELKAKAKNGEEIKTGEAVMVLDTIEEYAIVELVKEL